MTTKFRLVPAIAALLATIFTQELAVAMVTGQVPAISVSAETFA